MERLESGDPDVLAWTRGAGDDQLVVLVSFVGEPRRVALADVAPGSWTACVGTHREPTRIGADGVVELRPDEAVILGRSTS